MDTALAKQFSDLQPAAFAKIYDAVKDSAVAYVRKRGGDLEMANDILQEAMYRLFERLKYGKPLQIQTSIEGLMFGFVKTVCLEKFRRKQKSVQRTVSIDDDEGWMGDRLSDENQLSPDFYEGPSEQGIFKLLNTLGKSCKEVLIAFYVHKQALADIAEDLGLKKDYVKLKRFRCMEELKKKFKANK